MQPPLRFPAPNPYIERLIEFAPMLFMDIVGLGKMQMSLQTAIIEELQQLVRETDEFQRRDEKHELLARFTGDGMVLVFQSDVLSPVRCAIQLAQSLRLRPYIPVRMGIHMGPVHYIHDINHQVNVSGEGVIHAQRVMDCGDEGFILVSQHVAETIGSVSPWCNYMRYLGECTIKHGQKIVLYSLVTDEVGVGRHPRKMMAEAAQAVEKRLPRQRIEYQISSIAKNFPRYFLLALVGGLLLGSVCFLSPRFRADAYLITERLLSGVRGGHADAQSLDGKQKSAQVEIDAPPTQTQNDRPPVPTTNDSTPLVRASVA